MFEKARTYVWVEKNNWNSSKTIEFLGTIPKLYQNISWEDAVKIIKEHIQEDYNFNDIALGNLETFIERLISNKFNNI